MHPSVAEVLDFFEQKRAELQAASAAVPVHLIARRPAPEKWSVAEILAHVALVERRVLPLLRTTIETAAEARLGPEVESGAVVPTVNVERLLDRTRLVTTSKASEPPADADAHTARQELEDTRTALRGLLLEYDGVALSTIILPNPVIGPSNIYQWVVFLAGHAARHADQVRQVHAALVSARQE